MTDAPIALNIHDGNGPLPEVLREVVPAWMKANRINPAQVSGDHPIKVLTLPYQPATGQDGWLVQVIVFHQYYVGADGDQEQNLLTGRLVAFQRTVPLSVPFPAPTEPADEGTGHGEADREAAQEAPQEVVRPQEGEEVSDRHEGQGEERSGQGQAVRVS